MSVIRLFCFALLVCLHFISTADIIMHKCFGSDSSSVNAYFRSFVRSFVCLFVRLSIVQAFSIFIFFAQIHFKSTQGALRALILVYPCLHSLIHMYTLHCAKNKTGWRSYFVMLECLLKFNI